MSRRLSPSLLIDAVVLWLALPATAIAQAPPTGALSCLPSYTALQTIELVDAAHPQKLIRPLSLQNNGKTVVTKVQWRALSDEQDPHLLKTSVMFDPEFAGVSLPYNLYAVLVLLDGDVAGWFDFTHGCQGPGLSFFPGAEIRLPTVKLIGDRPQRLQIMVWGRL